MSHRYAELAFTPTIRYLQQQLGSRALYARLDHGEDKHHHFRQRETAFIQQRDSVYMATVNEEGWPYLQHRGGPAGFIKVLDHQTLGFADYSGNRQYITTGNLQTNQRASLFFMDYPNRRRLKLMGTVEVLAADDPRMNDLIDTHYSVNIERGFLIHLAAFDWNCPQHITPRYSEAEVQLLIDEAIKQTATHSSGDPS